MQSQLTKSRQVFQFPRIRNTDALHGLCATIFPFCDPPPHSLHLALQSHHRPQPHRAHLLAGPVPTRLLPPESTPLTQWLSIVHSALLCPAKSPSVLWVLTPIVVEWMNQRWCQGGFTPPPCWLNLPPPKSTLNKHRIEMGNRVWLENTAASFLFSSP